MQWRHDDARSSDVLHQIHAVALQGAVNPLQEVQRLALIVNGVEGRDDVERLRLRGPIEVAEIDGDELDVLQGFGRRLLTCGASSILRQVHPDEAAVRE
jgi:hypothetical protein